jgi:hypothetical protein
MIPAFGELIPSCGLLGRLLGGAAIPPGASTFSPRPRPANRAPARPAIPELGDAAAAGAVLECALPRAHAPQAGM